MGKNIPKIASIIGLIVSSIALMANPLLLMAQGNDNSSAQLRIFSGIISVTPPDNFAFDTIFLPPNTDPSFNTYKTLLPLTPGQVLRADDADDGTFNFKVTMSISNFNSAAGPQVIPFTNFATLTLANNTVDGIDASPASPPPATNNVTAPWSCAWSGQTGTLGGNCDADFDTAGFTGNGPLINTDPSTGITDTDTLLPVIDSSVYTPGDILMLDSGEYSTVTSIIDPIQIEVQRGVSGSIAAPQGPATGIVNMGTESSEIDIMVAPEPAGGRVGSYSVGLGIRTLVEPEYLEAADYTGQITFSLYQCVDLSCI